MPWLRPSLRVLDPPGAVAQLPDLRRRRSAEAAVGVRRAVEHAGEVVLAPIGQRTHRSMRHLWRPARTGFLLDQLISTRLWASGLRLRAPERQSEGHDRTQRPHTLSAFVFRGGIARRAGAHQE